MCEREREQKRGTESVSTMLIQSAYFKFVYGICVIRCVLCCVIRISYMNKQRQNSSLQWKKDDREGRRVNESEEEESGVQPGRATKKDKIL